MSADPEPSEPPEPPEAPPPRRMGRLGRFVILGAVLGAAALVLPRLPHEHEVEIRLGDPASVVSVELGWSREGDGETLQGGTWHFQPGRAPRSIETSVKLPDGHYAADVTVERAGGTNDELHRRVDLTEAGKVILSLR